MAVSKTRKPFRERRFGRRKPLSLYVMLYRDAVPVFACRSRDLGERGMFLNAAAGRVAPGATLEAEFALHTREGASHHRIAARVARTAGDGLGLEFDAAAAQRLPPLEDVLPPRTALRVAGRRAVYPQAN